MRKILFTVALCAAAQPRPNFSGNWLLNLSASDYSAPNTAKPDKITVSIQQQRDHFKYRWERYAGGKKGAFEVDVTVGGPAYESDEAGVVSMEWKGDKLIVTTLYNPGQDRQSENIETWALSADGRRLTDDVTVHPPQNRPPVHVVRVFDKQ
ncbi:MAG TPA: hypothetical protein VKX49_21895 [Bryobacteraceae bacterium]|nr:hypothetical protein [Bryobacteraceae bacterium]